MGGDWEITEKETKLASLYCDSLLWALGSTFPFPVFYHACNFHLMRIRGGHQKYCIIKKKLQLIYNLHSFQSNDGCRNLDS